MDNTIKNVLWAIGAIVVSVAIVAVFHVGAVSKAFGSIGDGITNFTGISIVSSDGITGKFDVSGSGTGTQFQRLNGGICYIQPYATTIAASSTAYVDCQGTAAVGTTNTGKDIPLTGVTAGDSVIANLTATTSVSNSLYGNISIAGVVASTTSGYIQLLIDNQTGGTFTWPTTGTATGTVYYFLSH